MNITDNLYCMSEALYIKVFEMRTNLTCISELINQWSLLPLFVRNESTGLMHNLNWDVTEITSIVNKR